MFENLTSLDREIKSLQVAPIAYSVELTHATYAVTENAAQTYGLEPMSMLTSPGGIREQKQKPELDELCRPRIILASPDELQLNGELVGMLVDDRSKRRQRPLTAWLSIVSAAERQMHIETNFVKQRRASHHESEFATDEEIIRRGYVTLPVTGGPSSGDKRVSVSELEPGQTALYFLSELLEVNAKPFADCLAKERVNRSARQSLRRAAVESTVGVGVAAFSDVALYPWVSIPAVALTATNAYINHYVYARDSYKLATGSVEQATKVVEQTIPEILNVYSSAHLSEELARMVGQVGTNNEL